MSNALRSLDCLERFAVEMVTSESLAPLLSSASNEPCSSTMVIPDGQRARDALDDEPLFDTQGRRLHAGGEVVTKADLDEEWWAEDFLDEVRE